MDMDLLPADIRREFQRTGRPVEWRIPERLKGPEAVLYRNRFAENLARKPAPEIVSSYVYLSQRQMGRLVSLAFLAPRETTSSARERSDSVSLAGSDQWAGAGREGSP